MSWKLDTEKINESAEAIIANLNEESIAVYCFIQDQWISGTITENKLFQFVFRSFYRIDNAGLTDVFKTRYFQLLEETRGATPNIQEICNELYKIKNHRGQNSLQFSFATKLASTTNSELPVYDSEVAKMYSYDPPPPSKPVTERLNNYLLFYSHLCQDYQIILKDNALQNAMHKFDGKFCKYSEKISPVKKIDFILWSFGKITRNSISTRPT